jgi:hypothetical protein
MNSFYLKTQVAEYLRYKRQCPVVVFERGLQYLDVPDVLAVSQDRKLIEVEVKISVADFRHDADKRKFHPLIAARVMERKQRYYCVPRDMVERIAIPANWGLMVVNDNRTVEVLKVAPSNRQAPRLTIKQVEEMVRHQTGTLISIAQKWCKLHALNTKDRVM